MHELRRMEKPVVFDADSLHLVKTNLELMRGWRSAILTPNRNEFQRLASAFDVEVDPQDPMKQLQEARNWSMTNYGVHDIFAACKHREKDSTTWKPV